MDAITVVFGAKLQHEFVTDMQEHYSCDVNAENYKAVDVRESCSLLDDSTNDPPIATDKTWGAPQLDFVPEL